MCVHTYIHTYNRLPWQLGFTPTISRGMEGAMVQIINQTGSANPLQVSCTKFLGCVNAVNMHSAFKTTQTYSTCIGYITRCRSLHDIHNRGPKARGCVCVETVTECCN